MGRRGRNGGNRAKQGKNGRGEKSKIMETEKKWGKLGKNKETGGRTQGTKEAKQVKAREKKAKIR